MDMVVMAGRFMSRCFFTLFVSICCLCGAGALGQTTLPTTEPSEFTITVRALIDGRSQLILKANTAQWRHFDNAAPGLHGGRNEPTIINSVKWFPQWEDSDMDPEVRVTKAMSDVFDKVDPALPAAAMTVTMTKVHCRDSASVVQQPEAGNQFTTVIELNDDQSPGSDWYEVKLVFHAKP
jgi:hypothetical protein